MYGSGIGINFKPPIDQQFGFSLLLICNIGTECFFTIYRKQNGIHCEFIFNEAKTGNLST